MTILFIDDINFHARGFPQLFRCIDSFHLRHQFHDFGNKGLKLSFGRYSEGHHNLQSSISKIKSAPIPEWLNYKHHDVSIFDIVRHELVAYVLASPIWHDQITPNTRADVFAKLVENNYTDLLCNLSAGHFWLSYWDEYFKKHSKKIAYICVFGNSLIYTQAAVRLAEKYSVVPYVFEHFFTGKHHFLEARLCPQQGASALRLPVPNNIQKDTAKIHNAFARMENKNVKPAPSQTAAGFQNHNKVIAIFAQVVNDFSLVGEWNPVLGSVALYKELIFNILKRTNCNLILKAHPYESRKHNLATNVTQLSLETWRDSLPALLRERLLIVCDFPMNTIFELCDAAITLNSQAGLECLKHNVPLGVLADAYYSRHAFTYDFSNIDQLIESINSGQLYILTDSQKENFQRFMTWSFAQCISDTTPLEEIYRWFCHCAFVPSSAKTVSRTEQSNPDLNNLPNQREIVSGDPISRSTIRGSRGLRNLNSWALVSLKFMFSLGRGIRKWLH